MSSEREQLLLNLAGCCCPRHPLSPVPDAAPLLLQGWTHRSAPRYLFTPKLPLWTDRYSEYVCAFHVDELNFDTLAQCHTAALEAGTARFDPAAKHSHTRITALILCDTAQADALEILTRFKKQSGHPLTFSAKLDYRLAAVDLAEGRAVCNRRGRGLRPALLAQVSAVDPAEHL